VLCLTKATLPGSNILSFSSPDFNLSCIKATVNGLKISIPLTSSNKLIARFNISSDAKEFDVFMMLRNLINCLLSKETFFQESHWHHQ
jgi:hypothetical protein